MRRPFWIPLAGSLRIAGMLTWMVALAACTEGSPDPSEAVSTRGTGGKSDVGGGGNAGASAGNSGNAGASAGNSGNAGNAGASMGAAGNAESAGASAGAGGEAARIDGAADGTGGTSAMHPDDAGATDAGIRDSSWAPTFRRCSNENAPARSSTTRVRAGASWMSSKSAASIMYESELGSTPPRPAAMRPAKPMRGAISPTRSRSRNA